MTPSPSRVLLMCLALAFASLWLGCGPDAAEDEWAPEFSGDSTVGDGLVLPDDELPCACGEGANEDAD